MIGTTRFRVINTITVGGIIILMLYTSLGTSSPLAMQLTLEGAVSASYSESEIMNDFPTITGYGGYQKSTGTIINGSKWKGVHLTVFLTSILGDIDYNISIIAVDDWKADFTKAEILGGIRTFDDTNTTLSIKALPVLAFEENDTLIGSDGGPLRLVFVGENNQSILTSSSLWVKQVDTIRIYTTSVVMQLILEGPISTTYFKSQIMNDLPTVTGYGGYQKKTGTIVNGSKWKGIHLSALLSSIQEDTDYNISVVAQDGYNMNFTKSEIFGGIRTFDETNTTLNVIALPVLAFEENDTLIGSEDGPLRLVFVGENNQSILTSSSLWVKQVDTIRILTTINETSTVPTTTDSQTTTTDSQNTTTDNITSWIPLVGMFFAIVLLVVRKRSIY